jgi:N-acetylglucosamine-6-phosphate deacetylase
MSTTCTFTGGPIFDGQRIFQDHAAEFSGDRLSRLLPQSDLSDTGTVVDLAGDILSPGYVDLQVNGGGGLMLNDAPTVETLERMAAAHRRLGTLHLLPTLITDMREATSAAITNTIEAIGAGVPGIAGLHLEGPHLSLVRKGAHDGALIRPMTERDLAELMDAKTRLPVLKVTIAPESVTPEQVRALSKAGILVALGHTDADFETCLTYLDAGASMATHLFNAMSQLGHRAPGLVGAALTRGDVSCGLIADGIHVHPAAMRMAFSAKARPGRIYLVSDAMAVAGTDGKSFHLGGREITRSNGCLTLADGTLAGADLDLTTAIRVCVEKVGLPLDQALRAATSVPAGLIGVPTGLVPGETRLQDMIRISADLTGATPVTDVAV